MVDAVSLASVALRLIAENGRTVTLVKKVPAPAGSSDEWKAAGTEVTTTAKMAFTPDVAILTDGGLTRRTNRTAYVGVVTGMDLKTFSHVVDGATRYQIINVEIYKPGDTEIAYSLTLER